MMAVLVLSSTLIYFAFYENRVPRLDTEKRDETATEYNTK